MKSIANAIEQNSNLKEIDLSHNEVSVEGTTSLALKINKTLCAIDVRSNKISSEAETTVSDILKVGHINLVSNSPIAVIPNYKENLDYKNDPSKESNQDSKDQPPSSGFSPKAGY